MSDERYNGPDGRDDWVESDRTSEFLREQKRDAIEQQRSGSETRRNRKNDWKNSDWGFPKLPTQSGHGMGSGIGLGDDQFLPFWVGIEFQFDPDGTFMKEWQAIVDTLTNPLMMQQILRQAVTQSVLRNIRQRFIQNLPNALEMESIPTDEKLLRLQGEKHRRTRRRSKSFMERVERMYDAISEHEIDGDIASANRLREKVVDMQADWYKELNTTPEGKTITPHKLSSGLFRSYAMHIVSMFSDAGMMHESHTNDGISIGIGNMQALNRIKTPSATEHIFHKGRTSSPYNIMWRHLEFGTGVYGRDPYSGMDGSNPRANRQSANNTGVPRTIDQNGAVPHKVFGQPGTWWYGKAPPNGLLLKGSKGVHALRTQQGLLYGSDWQNAGGSLEDIFGGLLQDVLMGRRAATL